MRLGIFSQVVGLHGYPTVPPAMGRGEEEEGGWGGLSIQTSDSSTVPHNPLKIALVWTGQHKEVFFGGPVLIYMQ